jgi:hypothetical protein
MSWATFITVVPNTLLPIPKLSPVNLWRIITAKEGKYTEAYPAVYRKLEPPPV